VIFATISLCVASQRVFVVVVVVAAIYFVMDSVQKLLDTPSYQTEGYFIAYKASESRYIV
jgi:uncharacterized protein HemY